MNYKIYIYALFLFLNIYILSGVNINSIMRKNATLQAKLLIMVLSISGSYLVTNFIFDFLSIS